MLTPCPYASPDGKKPGGILIKGIEEFQRDNLLGKAEKAIERIFPEQQERLLQELGLFLADEGIYSSKVIQNSRTQSPEVYWSSVCKLKKDSVLAPVGKRLCRIVPHTANQERVFSNMERQSEGRSRLSVQRVHKLTSVASQLRKMEKK